MVSGKFSNVSWRACAVAALIGSLAGCTAAVGDTAEGTPEYAPEASAAAGAAALADGGTDLLVDKEPGAGPDGVYWDIEIKTGCGTGSGTNATVYAQKRQYDRLAAVRVSTWTDRTYRLDNPNINDNEICRKSFFPGWGVINSYINPYAAVDRLRLWHSNTGGSPDWYVEYAIITWRGGFDGSYRCTFNRWIRGTEKAEASCSPYTP